MSSGSSDSQKQLLSLIRDFATEKSQGERRVVGFRKRIEELKSELEKVNRELDETKYSKEVTEQDLKGYELQLSLYDTSIQTLEARITSIQDEISAVGSDIDCIKREEDALREVFLSEMFQVNRDIRKFQEGVINMQRDLVSGISSDYKLVNEEDHQAAASRTFQEKLDVINSQINVQEQDYQAVQEINKQVAKLFSLIHNIGDNFTFQAVISDDGNPTILQLKQELFDLERKLFLVDAIINTTKELQELTRQTSELETACASFGEDLQSKCVCPNCQMDNVEALEGLL